MERKAMTDYETYRAAVERLRRLEVEGYDAVYRDTEWLPLCDKSRVYDAEHDATPATVEWLVSIGFVKDDDLGELRMGKFAVDYATRNRRLPVYFENRLLLNKPTRGQVLMLLSVFNTTNQRSDQ
jgi:hypothetical protein